MRHADEIYLTGNYHVGYEVRVFSSVSLITPPRFATETEARRFAWGLAHENQLTPVGNDKQGRAVYWRRLT